LPSDFDSSITAEFCCVELQLDGVAHPAGLAPAVGEPPPMLELPLCVVTEQPTEACAGRM
jgi:hypothetical protein